MGNEEHACLAVCIPTYKRCCVVQDFLERAAELYFRAGIDLYYYDSSPDRDTEQLVRSWMERFPNHIFYIRIPEHVHANMKVYKIFQLYGMRKTYDFIWVCNDAIRFTGPVLTQILSCLDRQYDMIEVNTRDVERLGTRVYEDRNAYFQDCAWELTLFGAAILNADTMLRGVDWVYYEQKYQKTELVNFSHVSFYFTRICKLKQFRALHMSVDPREFSSSIYKKGPGWYRDAAFIFCEAWVSTIEDLPECYTGKAEVMKKPGGYSMLKDEKSFLTLRGEEVFSLKILWKYRDKWTKVCGVPVWKLYLIAALPACLARFGQKETGLEKRGKKRLFTFCQSVPVVYLFGTGWGGYGYGELLNRAGIAYQGFCVSNTAENPARLCDHPVCALDGLDRERVGVVVSMAAEKGKVIQAMLKERGFQHVYFDPDFFDVVIKKI